MDYIKSKVTCKSPAIYYCSCEICGEKGTETFEYGEKLSHTEIKIDENIIVPSCILNGSHEEVIYCSMCEEELSRKTIIDKAQGHSYVDGKCEICGDKQDSIGDVDPEKSVVSRLLAEKVKMSYCIGDVINTSDIIITATYSDGTTKNISIKDCTTNLSDIDTSSAGTKTLTIQYTENGKTVKTEVAIKILEKSGSEDESTPNPPLPSEDNKIQLQLKKVGGKLHFDWNPLDKDAYYDISYSLTEELFPVYEENNCFEVTNLKTDSETMHYECVNSYSATDVVYFRVRMRKGDEVQYSNAVELVNSVTKPENPEEAPQQDFTYTINDDETVTITKYIGTGKTVVVPATIDGYTVTVIGEEAFKDCTSITSLTLPTSIKEIGDFAFSGCTNMKTFSGMTENLESLGYYAFRNCSSLTSIELNEGRKNIVKGLFEGCTSLSNVVIPDSVETIQYFAFSGCDSLKTVSLPKSLKEVQPYAFDDSGITTINYAGTSDEWEAKVEVSTQGNVKFFEAQKVDCNGSSFNKDIDYNIFYKPSTITGVNLTNDNGQINLTWDSDVVDKYFVYRSVGSGEYKQIATISTWYSARYVDKDVSNGKKYQYKIASVIENEHGTFVSDLSSPKTICYLSKPTISSAKSSAAKKMTVKWKKNSKAAGYEIQYSLKSNFSGKKTVKVKGASKVNTTIKNLKKGKTYYVRVRVYKTSGGKKYTSVWSSKKKVKVK